MIKSLTTGVFLFSSWLIGILSVALFPEHVDGSNPMWPAVLTGLSILISAWVMVRRRKKIGRTP